jgi:transcriptional regulator with XRE-family HTH domain
MGRKNKYKEFVEPYLETIKAMCQKGLTEEQICENIGVGRSTFQRYKNQFRELRDTLKRGRQDMIAQVENAQYKRAIGYEYTVQKISIEPTGKVNKDGAPIIKKKIETTTKYMPPDVKACIFILKNRSPQDWHDRKPHEILGNSGKEFKIVVEHVEENNSS